jgi:hypothetical protein
LVRAATLQRVTALREQRAGRSESVSGLAPSLIAPL